VQLYTKAWVKRGEDVVHGDYIMYDANAEYAEVIGGNSQSATPGSGRVRAVIQPKNKKAPVEIKPVEPANKAKPDASNGSGPIPTVKDTRFSRTLEVSKSAGAAQ